MSKRILVVEDQPETPMSLRERTHPGLEIIEPCLPSPAKAPPSGPGWIHEIKHDGFRILARRDAADNPRRKRFFVPLSVYRNGGE
jgi:ATP-dependent DNA ligase